MTQLGTIFFALSMLAVLSVLVTRLTERLGIPSLLLFLAFGMIAGSEGLGHIAFDDARVAQVIGIGALILILYAGGLDTVFTHIRPVLARGIVLSTIGVAVSAAAVGLFVIAVSDMPWRQSLLLGCIAASTDAAVVFSVLRSRGVRLPQDLRSLLELESGANDPTAVFLTLALVTALAESPAGPAALVGDFFLQMSAGVAIGFVMGKLAVLLVNRIQLEHDGLYPVLSLALVAVTYGVASISHASGFLAVYVAGIVMGNSVYIHKRSLIRFHDGLAWLMQIAMFLTFGLLVFPSQLLPVLGLGLLVTAFLTFVARPFSVALSLAFSRFGWRQQAFVSWVGLRGAAPIILATFPLVADVDGAGRIFNVVFFVVLSSVLLQGTTVSLAAKWLRLRGPAFSPPAFDSGELPGSTLMEYRVPPQSPLVGRQLAKAGLPDTAKALLLRRYGEYRVLTGGTRLRRDDVLLVLADEAAAGELDARTDLERLDGPSALRAPGASDAPAYGGGRAVDRPSAP